MKKMIHIKWNVAHSLPSERHIIREIRNYLVYWANAVLGPVQTSNFIYAEHYY